jgi:DNA-binding PadR family transcriptional regulator
MSAMRVLILGVLMKKRETHGYEIKRELESWNAEKWANIAYGSIYFALKKMAEEKLIEAVPTEEDTPARILYRITETGKEEFMRLLREQWWNIKPLIDPFQVALAFMHYLPKEELIVALETRLDHSKTLINSIEKVIPIRAATQEYPRHIYENFKLVLAHYKAEAGWIKETLEKVKAGELP